ncbi:MAG: hypothetical protein DID92_2727744512 [Candidatus Nitrotoga sp. SPKER]|nr:MAG: hypothetical protein DID92_2727744512 [Candidatus Nitrotoga sp. SPKER]
MVAKYVHPPGAIIHSAFNALIPALMNFGFTCFRANNEARKDSVMYSD